MSQPADKPRSLEHPLPAGMRDLLPEEARSRRQLARALLGRLEVWGYAPVTLPAFEFADVLERGLGTLEAADVLRFVEPESGEVAALRPDMTPQIARMVATRLWKLPPPFRLAYEGTVLRRRGGRARPERQIPQVGVELVGMAGKEGDLELLSVAVDALRGAGLTRFTLDVGDAGVVRALLAEVPAAVARDVSDALARKDEAELRTRGAGLERLETLAALLRLHGGRDALVEALGLLASTPAQAACARLAALAEDADRRGLGAHLAYDLGAVKHFAYYTGLIFEAYAPGVGDAVGAGGRYDELLGRFGTPMPSVGFALDLDRLATALRAAGVAREVPRRVVVVGPADDPRLAELRARGVAAVALPTRDAAVAYAAAWGFTEVL